VDEGGASCCGEGTEGRNEMSLFKKNVTRTESEVVVGEDQFGVPIIECPEIKLSRKGAVTWYKCKECGNEAMNDTFGTYYHKLVCSKSNGIGYNEERKNMTLPHNSRCDCMTCQPQKEK
jgi:hypothetical protein